MFVTTQLAPVRLHLCVQLLLRDGSFTRVNTHLGTVILRFLVRLQCLIMFHRFLNGSETLQEQYEQLHMFLQRSTNGTRLRGR